ncbi:MAG: amylo-alpha-1,6-glucosidase [Candidatus Omnitrophota bacterium]
MNRSKRLQRFLSGVVAITFFVTSALTPVPVASALPAGGQVQNVESPTLTSSFTIPAEFGRVTDQVKGSEGSSLLIHIQEAHANYDAQKNIRNILGFLTRDYGIREIFLEGAGHQLKPELFNFFPEEPETQQAANEKLLQAGELTGTEVFLLDKLGERGTGNEERNVQRLPFDAKRGKAVEAWGVEAAQDYAQNRETFRQVFEQRRNIDRFSAVVSQQWQKAAALFSNKPLRDFLNHEIAFDEKRLPLADWLDLLKAEASRSLKIDLTQTQEQKDWPVLVRFFRVKTLGNKIDQAQVAKEKNAFLADLQSCSIPSELLQQVTRFLERRNGDDLPAYQTRFTFEKLMDLLPGNYSFAAYPNIRLMIQQGILLSEIQGEMLQEEIKTLVGKVTGHFVKTEQDKRLVEALRQQRLLEKLLRLELSREEYEEILSRKISPSTLMKELAIARGQGSAILDVPAGLERLYQRAIRFYEGAIERESGMMKRTLGLMKDHEQTKAVLITGGFHSEGMKEKAIRAGLSYVEITPRIGEVSEDSNKNYLETLLGKRTVQNSQIAARVRSDMAFLGETSRNWRRELAGTGVRISEILRSVPRITPQRANQAVSSFLQKAISEISASAEVAPSFARSEVRGKTDVAELKAELMKIADRTAEGFDLLRPLDVSDYTQVAQVVVESLESGVTSSQIASAKKFLGDYKRYASALRARGRSEMRERADVVALKAAIKKIAEGKDEGLNWLSFVDVQSYTRIAREHLEGLGRRPSSDQTSSVKKFLEAYQSYVKKIRVTEGPEKKRGSGNVAFLDKALARVANQKAVGFKLLKPRESQHLMQFASLLRNMLKLRATPLAVAAATGFLANYEAYAAVLREMAERDAKAVKLIKALTKIADGTAAGFSLLKPADGPHFKQIARVTAEFLRSGVSAFSISEAERVLQTYRGYVDELRPKSRSEIRKTSESVQSLEMNPISGDHIAIGFGRSFDVSMKLRTAPGTAKESLRATVHIVYQDRDGEKAYDQSIPPENIAEARDAKGQIIPNEWVGKVTIKPEHTGHYRFKVNVKTTDLSEQEDPSFWASGDDATFNVHRLPSWFDTTKIHPYILWIPDLKSMGLPMTWEGIEALIRKQKETKGKNLFELSPFFAMDHDAFFAPRSRVATSPLLIDWSTVTEDSGWGAVSKHRSFLRLHSGHPRKMAFARYASDPGIRRYADYVAGKVWDLGQQPVAGVTYRKEDFGSIEGKRNLRDFVLYEQFISFEKIYHLLKSAHEIGARVLYNVPYWESDDGAASYTEETRRFYLQENGKVSAPKFSNGQVLGGLAAWNEAAITDVVNQGGEDPRLVPFKFWAERFYEVFQEDPKIKFAGSRIDAIHMAGINPTAHSPAERISEDTRFWDAIAHYFSDKDLLVVAEQLGGDEFSQTHLTRLGFLQYDFILDLWGREGITLGAFLGDPKTGLAAISRGHSVSVVSTHDSARSPRTYAPLFFSLAAKSDDLQGAVRSAAEVLGRSMEDSVQQAIFEPILKLFGPAFFVILHLGPQVEPFLLSLDARGTLSPIKTEALDEKGVAIGATWNTATAGKLDFSKWIKIAAEIREENPAIGRSKMTLLPNNDPEHAATFAKTYQDNHLLVMANFSTKSQEIQCPVPFGVFGIEPATRLAFTELVTGKPVTLESDRFAYAMEPGQVAVFRLDSVPSEKWQDKVIDATISGPSGAAAQIVGSVMPFPIQSEELPPVKWDWDRKERPDHMLLPGQNLVVENALPFKVITYKKSTREQRTFLPMKVAGGYQVVVHGLESGEYDLVFWWDDNSTGDYVRFEGRSYQVEVIPEAKDIGTLKDPFYVALVQGHKDGAAKGLGQFISAQFDDAGRLLRAAIFASGAGMNFEGQEWGRDTMMALVGIAAMAREGESFWVWDEKIHEKRWVPAADVLKGIVRRWVNIDDRGRKRIDGFRQDGHIMYNVIGWAGDYVNGVNFNTVDAPLWFLEAVMGYVLATGDKDFLNEPMRDGQTLSDVLWETVDRLRLAGSSYANSKNTPDPAIKISGYLSDRGMPEKSIQMDAETGFIFCPHHKFTWMDTEFTWREGYPVEIQALWARSLKQWAEVVKLLNPNDPRIPELSAMAVKVKENIGKYFWNSNRQYPSDILGTDFGGRGFMTPEQSIRNGMDDQVITSNPVIAAWAGALDSQKAKKTLELAEKELHIPGALRSRGPNEKVYYPDRGAAWLATGDGNAGYHSGQGWVWPLPVHMVAMAEHGIISPEEALVRLRMELASVQKRNSAHSLPELIDSNPGTNGDHQQGGPAAQTWSVALAAYAFKTLHESLRSEVRQGETPLQGIASAVLDMSGIVGVSATALDYYAKAGRDHGARSELRTATPDVNELTWAEATTPRVAKEHFYSRQWECGLPMDLLEKIAALYSSFEAGEISQATLTGGLGALMPDLFEGWAAIGMNVTGVHPLWNFIKNAPGKGYDQEGRRKFLADIIKQFLEETDIEFETTQFVKGTPKTVFFRVYKTYTPVHKSPQYYLDAYTQSPDGKEEPFFQEVYDDHGKREEDMAFFAEASELLIQKLENDLNPNVTVIDHEVFASLPARHLKRAKRVTFNHTVFRPGLFEAREGYYDQLGFSERLRSTIAHDGNISIADYTAEQFDLISGVNLVEHKPALLNNIFRTAWHRVKGYYDREKQIRSTNGVFLPRWQSPSRRVLIERLKEELEIPRPAHKLPVEADDRQFFEELDKEQNRDLRERFKDQDQWVVAGDVAELLIWLREKRSFTGEYDWLGNSFKAYQEKHSLDPEPLVEHLREMQELLAKAVGRNHPEDWAELQSRFGEAYELLLADPIAANVRRFVPYKGPDKYEEILKGIVAKAVGQAVEGVRASVMSEGSMAAESLAKQADEAIAQAGLKIEFSGKFSRPYEPLFSFWKAFKDGKDANQERYQREFEGLRDRLKDQPVVEELRNTLSRLLVGGRTFDVSEAHDRLRYIRFMTELLGLEDRIATLEDHTYYEAQIIFRGSQAGVMLSDEDLEASATSMMKVKCNGGEVAGPFAGSNPEIWTIRRDKKTGEIVEVLNEKGEPNTAVITQDILREKLRTGEWELLDGVFVAYSDGEKSTQEGGGRRPSASSLLEALQTIKTLRSNPAIRRQRSYQAVSSSWKVDSLSQVMAHASLLEDMLKEHEEREAMFQQLTFENTDYAMPMAADDFGWKTQHPFKKHTIKGLGLFGMFRSFRSLKTWQRPRELTSEQLEKLREHIRKGEKWEAEALLAPHPSTRGMEALDSLKYHAYNKKIFKYLRENVLDRLSSGLQPFKDKIETLEAQAKGADDREMVALNLQAMDLTEKLLVRMAGDWFERYMQAGPEAAELLRREITQGVSGDYQPWAEYIARYLEGHPNARALRTRENKIRSFIFTSAGKKAMMINLNVGAPVHREKDEYFDGFKARTQVPIDDKTLRQLTGNKPNVKFIQLREPKLNLSFRVRPKEELTSEVGIGIPMPSGIEVIKWVVMQWHHLLPEVKKRVEQQEPLDRTPAMELINEMGLTQNLLGIAKQDPSAMNSLKQLIRETRAGYKPPEGMDPSDHFFGQLQVLSDLGREDAVKIFGENLKALMGLIGFFRPDLLKTAKLATWDPAFNEKISRTITEMQTAFGEGSAIGKHHNYYVLNSSHQGALVLARKDAKGNAFFIIIQFAANDLDAASDGKISTRISSESLTKLIDEGAYYQVLDLLTKEYYSERNDLLQGWVIRTPFVADGDRIQMLYLEKKTSENRSEARAKEDSSKAQRSEVREEQTEEQAVRTKQPFNVEHKKDVMVLESRKWLDGSDMDGTLEKLADIILFAKKHKMPILLRGFSTSPAESDLLALLGFASFQSHKDAEKHALTEIIQEIAKDDNARFEEQGENLTVFAGEKEWRLRIAPGVETPIFGEFINNRLKGEDARKRGIASFTQAVFIFKRVTLKDPAPVIYELSDIAALAKETGLDPELVRSIVITQTEYNRLGSASLVRKLLPGTAQEIIPETAQESPGTKEPAKAPPKSGAWKEKFLLKLALEEIKMAWSQRQSHWAVRRAEQEKDDIAGWDHEFKRRNMQKADKLRQSIQEVGDRAKEGEWTGYFDGTPYSRISELEASIAGMLNSSFEETPQALRNKIKQVLEASVRLQALMRDRTVSFRGLPNAESHSEILSFFAKDIATLRALQEMASSINASKDKALMSFLGELLERRPRFKVAQPADESGEVELGLVRKALSELKAIIEERRELYEQHSRPLAETVGQMYGDILQEIDEALTIDQREAFVERLRRITNLLVTVWSSDNAGWWFMGKKRISIPEETKVQFRSIMQRILKPLFLPKEEEVDAFIFGSVRSKAVGRSESRTGASSTEIAAQRKLPFDVQSPDQVRVVELDLETLLSELPEVIRGAQLERKPVFLRGVSSSPDEDDLFQAMGFVPVESRQDVEARILARLLAKIEANQGVQFKPYGSSLTVVANGETWNLMLTSDRYSENFKNFIGKNPQEAEARSKGFDGFRTEVSKKTVILRDPVPVLFELQDTEALATEMGLPTEQLTDVLVTQSEYAQLKSVKPVTISSSAITADTLSTASFSKKAPKTWSDAEKRQLSEIMNGIQVAWKEMEAHWAVQEVGQRKRALDEWDLVIQAMNQMIRADAKAVDEMAEMVRGSGIASLKKMAAELFGFDFDEGLVGAKALTRKAEAARLLDNTSYEKILKAQALVKKMLEGTAKLEPLRLQTRIKNVFSAMVRLQTLIRARALSLKKLPTEGLHPEVQYLFVKDIVISKALRQVTRKILGAGNEELIHAAKAALGDQPPVTFPQGERYGRVDYNIVQQVLFKLKNDIVDSRRDIYNKHPEPLFGATAGRMYGDLSKEIERVLAIEHPKEFAEQLCPTLDTLAMLWLYDEEGMWFHGIEQTRKRKEGEISTMRRARYRGMLDITMRPLYFGTQKEVLSFSGMELDRVGTARSELRTALNAETLERFLKINEALDGGTRKGFERVTTELTDGIWSLVAHTVHAVDLMVSLFDETAARDAQGLEDSVLAEPKTLLEKARLATARRALGIPATISAGDAFIIRPGLAFKDGALFVKKMVFGDAPVVIYDPKGEATAQELKSLQQINARLAQAQLPLIQVVKDLNRAQELLKSEVEKGARQRSAGPIPSLHLKVMVNVLDPLALLLKQQYKDDAVLMTSQRFKAFLELAGVATLVSRMQSEYLATSRSA